MQQTVHSGAQPQPQTLFDWKPDAERLGREVRSAELKGRRDELTLAEIECSLDLLDAELGALRSRPGIDVTSREIRELAQVRSELVTLATRLKRLPE